MRSRRGEPGLAGGNGKRRPGARLPSGPARWALAGVMVGGLVRALALLCRRYAVEGRSMLRAYADGDRLVAEGFSYRLRPPRVGEAVIVRRTDAPDRLDLKRIAAGAGAMVTVRGEERLLAPDEWFLLGDNLDESADSRQLGPVTTKDLVGRVWLRYATRDGQGHGRGRSE